MDKRITYLHCKAYENNEGRFVTGWATTPARDLALDVVVPEGAKFSLPLPLLAFHKHDEPIGAVVEANVSKAGIRIKAKLTAGVRRAEEIWKLILDGGLSAVSVSFSGLKSTPIAGGGTRWDEWLWHELSVVSVGCNPEARIVVGKAFAYATSQPAVEKIPHPVYIPNHDVVKDFASACASRPDLRVSPQRSYKTGNTWQLCDDNGALLAAVSPMPEAKSVTPHRQKSSTAQAELLHQVAEGVVQLAEHWKGVNGRLEARIAELERQQQIFY